MYFLFNCISINCLIPPRSTKMYHSGWPLHSIQQKTSMLSFFMTLTNRSREHSVISNWCKSFVFYSKLKICIEQFWSEGQETRLKENSCLAHFLKWVKSELWFFFWICYVILFVLLLLVITMWGINFCSNMEVLNYVKLWYGKDLRWLPIFIPFLN